MHTLLRGLLVAGAFMLAGGTLPAFADGLENGDFSKGKSRWMGDGIVVYLKPDGTISPTDDSKPGSLVPPPVASLGTGTTPTGANPASTPSDQKPKTTPIIEVKLKSTQFADLFQKFRTPKEMDVVNAEVVFKGAADFKLNDKATVFDREITWKPGALYYWSALVHPKVDVHMRLDKRDNYMYKLDAVKPGSDWQKTKVRWDNVGGGQDVTFHFLVAPGHGSIYIKSVTLTP
jgi:hypothetical protein